jgi:hypothetical protein
MRRCRGEVRLCRQRDNGDVAARSDGVVKSLDVGILLPSGLFLVLLTGSSTDSGQRWLGRLLLFPPFFFFPLSFSLSSS